MFGRKKSAEGFYTGDAPASAPGLDGAEPAAYTGVPGAFPAQGADQQYPVPADRQYAQPGAPPPGAQQPGTPPPDYPPPGAPQFTPASTLNPETAARVQAALAKPPRMGGLGLVILIPIVIAALGGLVGIGAAIYAGAKASSAVSDAFSSVEMPTAIAPGDAAGDPAADPAGEPVSESAAVVTARYDEPALAEISRPEFTVTIGQPEIIKKKDARVTRAPGTGRYLVFPVTFTALPGARGLLDIVDANQFVLVPTEATELTPTEATELTPTFAAVDGSLTLAAVHADETETGFIAFDTRAKSGMLQLRDDAGDVMIEWLVGEAE